MRYFPIDRIEKLELGDSITGIKCVTLSDDILHDHFPENPIFPGALLMEALAQLSGILVEKTVNAKDEGTPRLAVLARVEKLSFNRMFVPGDRIVLEATLDALNDDGARTEVQASVNGEVGAKGTLLFVLSNKGSPGLIAQRQAYFKVLTASVP